MTQYSLSTWLAFGVALLIGVGIYFGYGIAI
ncbi:MAG: amino acid permease C-terminal domain-containing protein [Streptococcus parasanguinis]